MSPLVYNACCLGIFCVTQTDNQLQLKFIHFHFYCYNVPSPNIWLHTFNIVSTTLQRNCLTPNHRFLQNDPKVSLVRNEIRRGVTQCLYSRTLQRPGVVNPRKLNSMVNYKGWFKRCYCKSATMNILKFLQTYKKGHSYLNCNNSNTLRSQSG